MSNCHLQTYWIFKLIRNKNTKKKRNNKLKREKFLGNALHVFSNADLIGSNCDAWQR